MSFFNKKNLNNYYEAARTIGARKERLKDTLKGATASNQIQIIISKNDFKVIDGNKTYI